MSQVGVQLALCVARVMRSEANRGEATVLEGFVDTMRRSSLPGHALLALLHTSKELRSMRLPAQRQLASQVGLAMVACLLPLWRASVEATFDLSGAPSASSGSIRLAILHTKVLRQVFGLASLTRPLASVLEDVARDTGPGWALGALSSSVTI